MDEMDVLKERSQKLEIVADKFKKELKSYYAQFERLSKYMENRNRVDFEGLSELVKLYEKIDELSNFCKFITERQIRLCRQIQKLAYQDLSDEEKIEADEYRRKLLGNGEENGFRK